MRGTHAKLAPLIQQFIEDVLFVEKTDLFDDRLIARLADSDVREHIRAVFVPLIRQKTTLTEVRSKAEAPLSVTTWRPFQVTHSERHPTFPADRTPFNLVPCNRELEVALARFANHAEDVAAFCKNAGPQALRIDYLASGGRLAFYTPDFFIRKSDGASLLTETKGREDIDVPAKARAAIEWCKSASASGVKWEYLYVPEEVFQRLTGNKIDDLARACAPALADLLHEAESAQIALPFYEVTPEQKAERVEEFISAKTVADLPSRYRKAIEEAVSLFKFLEHKGASLSPCFTPLLGPLDEAAKGMMVRALEKDVPANPQDQRAYFEPSYRGLKDSDHNWLHQNALKLKKLLVFKIALMPLGLLSFCFEYAYNDALQVGGVFASIRQHFARFKDSQLADRLNHIKDIRNTYVAHQEQELLDPALARTELKTWISGLAAIYQAHHGQ